MAPKIHCKNEQENRKFQFEDTNPRARQRHEAKIAKQLKEIPLDIKLYWNNIEAAVLAKIAKTTASTAAYNLKDIQGAYTICAPSTVAM